MLGLQRGGLPAQEITRLMNSYFELTELHIHPRAQGRGLGEALARRLLAGRSEKNVLLSTPETNGDPTARGGYTGGWASPTSSAATTSPVTHEHSRSWAARCPSRPR